MVFSVLASIGFGRAAWIAGLLVFALVSMDGQEGLLGRLLLLLVLVLTVPIVGERVLPEVLPTSRTCNACSGDDWSFGALGGAVEERSRCPAVWEWLGFHLVPYLGQIFGFGGQFGLGNPTLLPTQRLPVPLCGAWNPGSWTTGRSFGSIFSARSGVCHVVATSRYDVRVLLPVIMVMFLVQLFDNGFAIRFVAERFFISAGLVFGMWLQWPSERSDVAFKISRYS